MRFRYVLLILVSAASWTCALSAETVTAAGKRLVSKPAYDPAAPVVELFDGIEQDKLDVRLIPNNSLAGSVFIENKSDQPITVKLPRAVAAVQILKQGFGGAGAGGRGGAGQGGGIGGAGGQGQALGGGFGGTGGIGGGGGGFGGGGGGFGGGGGIGGGQGAGFFTIPPDRTLRISLTSVCLNYGKADPRPKMTYKLVPLETYTSDPVLRELLINIGGGQLDSGAAQAAAWHLTDKMTWDELSEKRIEQVGFDPEPYFSGEQIVSARQIVAAAQSSAREHETNSGRTSERIREKIGK